MGTPSAHVKLMYL